MSCAAARLLALRLLGPPRVALDDARRSPWARARRWRCSRCSRSTARSSRARASRPCSGPSTTRRARGATSGARSFACATPACRSTTAMPSRCRCRRRPAADAADPRRARRHPARRLRSRRRRRLCPTGSAPGGPVWRSAAARTSLTRGGRPRAARRLAAALDACICAISTPTLPTNESRSAARLADVRAGSHDRDPPSRSFARLESQSAASSSALHRRPRRATFCAQLGPAATPARSVRRGRVAAGATAAGTPLPARAPFSGTVADHSASRARRRWRRWLHRVSLGPLRVSASPASRPSAPLPPARPCSSTVGRTNTRSSLTAPRCGRCAPCSKACARPRAADSGRRAS